MFKTILLCPTPFLKSALKNQLCMLPKLYKLCGEARNGSEAFRLMDRTGAELVFADEAAVGENRQEQTDFFEKMRRDYPQTAVVVVSAENSLETAVDVLRQGAAEYLPRTQWNPERLLGLHDRLQSNRQAAYGNHVKQIMKNGFIGRLLEGRELEKEELGELLRIYDVRLEDRAVASVAVLIPEGESAEELAERIRRLPAHRRIERLYVFFADGPRRLVLLFHVVHNSYLFQTHIYEEYVGALSERLGLPMGISGLQPSAAGVQRAVRQSDRMLRDRFCRGEQRLREAYGKAVEAAAGRDAEALRESLEAFIREGEAGTGDSVLLAERLLRRMRETVWGCETEADSGRTEEPGAALQGQWKEWERLCVLLRQEQRRLEHSVRHLSVGVRGVLQEVEKNYAGISSMKEIADRLNYNADYLYRAFKEEMGISFVDYLTRVRLSRGAQLLLRQESSVAEVAEQVGYANNSYFSRKFRERYGSSPAEWRKGAGRKSG